MLSNTHFSIAIHVLIVLAYHKDEVLGSERLAGSVDTNPSFLRGLIGRLKEAGLVETQMGKGGGTRLGKKADAITLRDVYLATECRPGLKTHGCSDTAACFVQAGMNGLLTNINDRVEHAVKSELEQTTIAELMTELSLQNS